MVVDAVVGADVRPSILRKSIAFTDDDSRFVFSLLLEPDGERHRPAVAREEFECGCAAPVCLSNNGIDNNHPSGGDE